MQLQMSSITLKMPHPTDRNGHCYAHNVWYSLALNSKPFIETCSHWRFFFNSGSHNWM